MSAIALYYPWRHFQDDDWLKLALLAWDKIARVRPSALPDIDGLIVRQLLAETDILVDIVPSEADLATVTGAFTDLVASHERELVARFSTNAPWEEDERYAPAFSNTILLETHRNILLGSRGSYLYAGPEDPLIARTLCDLLTSLDLASPRQAGDLNWISVRGRFGSTYLAVLADAIARHNMLSPVTDSDRMHRAFGALDRVPEMLFSDNNPALGLEDADSAYLQLALNAVLEPRRLTDVPVATLVKFRERYKAELVTFRQHIDGLSTDLQAIAAIENLDVARAHLESLYERVTKPQLDELRRALRGLGIESTIGAMALKIDLNTTAGTILGAIAAAGGQWAVAGAAAVIAVTPYVSGIRKRRQEIAAAPVAFLLAADRQLTGKSLLPVQSDYLDEDGGTLPRLMDPLQGRTLRA